MRESESLSDLLKREGGLDELRAKKYTRQLLKGLQCLHQRNAIHQDIRCQNIFLDHNGYYRLVNFGSARFLGSKVSVLIDLHSNKRTVDCVQYH